MVLAAFALAALSAAAVESAAAVLSLLPEPHAVRRTTDPTKNRDRLNLKSFIDFEFKR
jgi:hypothetical protein